MKKRLLSVLLAVAMVLGMLVIPVAAASLADGPVTNNTITVRISDDKTRIEAFHNLSLPGKSPILIFAYKDGRVDPTKCDMNKCSNGGDFSDPDGEESLPSEYRIDTRYDSTADNSATNPTYVLASELGDGSWSFWVKGKSTAGNPIPTGLVIKDGKIVLPLSITAGTAVTGPWTVGNSVPETKIATVEDGSFEGRTIEGATLPAGLDVSLKGDDVVISGTPTAVYAGGSVTLTAKDSDETTGKTCTVTLPAIGKGTLQLAAGTAETVNIGKAITLTATVQTGGGNAVTDTSKYSIAWSSADTTIASVDAATGVVTGKKVGGPVNITSTLTVVDTANYGNGSPLTATFPVTVSGGTQAVLGGVSEDKNLAWIGSAPRTVNELTSKGMGPESAADGLTVSDGSGNSLTGTWKWEDPSASVQPGMNKVKIVWTGEGGEGNPYALLHAEVTIYVKKRLGNSDLELVAPTTKVYDGTTALPADMTAQFKASSMYEGKTLPLITNFGGAFTDARVSSNVQILGAGITWETSDYYEVEADVATTGILRSSIVANKLTITAKNLPVKTKMGVDIDMSNYVEVTDHFGKVMPTGISEVCQITWQAYNLDVVKFAVNSSKLTPVSVGSTTVTATVIPNHSYGGGNYNATGVNVVIDVTVENAVEVDLTLNGGDMTQVYTDQPVQGRKGTSTDNDKISGITYKVKDGNPDVASVDADGKLTIKKVGTEVISVTANANVAGYASKTVEYTLTVTPKTLTVADGTYKVTKVYDGNTTAGTASGELALNGTVGSDVVTVTGTVGAYADKNAGINKTVTITGLTLGGTDAAKYTLNGVNTHSFTKAEITKKPLTVDSATATDREYNGNTSVVLSAVTSSDVVSPDAVTITATGTMATSDAGTGKTVTLSNVALSGGDSANYTIASTTAAPTVNITPKELTLNTATATSRVYSEGDVEVEVTKVTLGGVLNSDDVTVDVTNVVGTMANADAGTGKSFDISGAALTGGKAGNYTLATDAKANAGTVTISKAAMKVAANPATEKMAVGGTKNLSTNLTVNDGAGNTVDPSNYTIGWTSANPAIVSVNATSGEITGEKVGGPVNVTATLTLAGSGATNYTVSGSTARIAVTIEDGTPVNLTLDMTDLTQVYTDQPVQGRIGTSTNTEISGITYKVKDGNADVALVDASGMLTIKGVGTEVISVTAEANQVGFASTTKDYKVIVTAKALSLGTATATPRTYDGTKAVPGLAVTLDGVLNSDDVALIGLTGELDSADAGTRSINVKTATLTGTKKGNYTLSATSKPNAGTVEIATKELELNTATADSREYDGTTDITVKTVTLTGVVAGDVGNVTVNLANVVGELDSADAGARKISISNAALGGTRSGNYTLKSDAKADAGTVTITPKEVELGIASATDRPYDGTTAITLTGVTVTGGMPGDDVAAAATGVLDSANVGTPNINLSGATLTGTTAGNYKLKSPSKTGAGTVTITAVALTVKAKTGNAPLTGGKVSVLDLLQADTGLVNGETLAAIHAGAFNGKTLTYNAASKNWTATAGGSTVTVVFYQPGTPDTTDPSKIVDGSVELEAKAYPFTIAVDADPAFGNYDLQALAVPGGNAMSGTATVTGQAPTPPSPPSGGSSGPTTYMVSYAVGEHGTFAAGSNRNESVESNKSPSKMPEVVAEEGWKFLGWSIDGKTVVDPATVKITKSVTFTALYEEEKVEDLGLAFDKTITEPYIKGIQEEGGPLEFRPEANMTRGEVAAIIARTLTVKMETGKVYSNGQFPDVAGDEWFAEYAGFLADLGVVKGLEDGTFGGGKLITRAEFVTMMVRVNGIVNGVNPFSDVSMDNWAYDYITSAAAEKLVQGGGDGLFRPTANITRAEAVTIMNRILGWNGPAVGEMKFVDVAADHWAYNDIINASTSH